MSLTVAMRTAVSGLQAAQSGLRATSDNIANVNTPGYVRKLIDQKPLVAGGVGMGVEVSGVKRVTDQYLQGATISASADAGRWDMVSHYLDNAQSLYGDPSGTSSFFSRLDKVWSAFAVAADDPSSSLLRSQAIANVGDFVNEAGRINGQITDLGRTVDAQASADISRINDLLDQIHNLNADVSRAKLGNADASGSENIQSQLVDELSGLMNIQVAARASGGVTIRSAEGRLLAGDGTASKLSYNHTDAGSAYVAIEPVGGIGQADPITITGGSMRGLMDLRNTLLPGMADQLGEFVSRAAQRINAAHNAGTAVPAPSSLTGRDTGLDLPTAIVGFTGKSTLAILNAAGVVQHKVAIDFDAQTLSVNGGAATGFTPTNFLASLNGALGANGTASFANRALSINAAGSNGIAIDEGTSLKAGRAFSHFFGLNDLVRPTGFATYETGLKATDAHGFTPGDTITFSVAQSDGKPIRDITVAIPATTTMQDLLNSLNASSTGVGLYGAFGLDTNGKLAFSPSSGQSVALAVKQDLTQRGTGGPSMSQLFGLGAVERSGRASRWSVDQTIQSNPLKLSLAQLDLGVAAGQPAVRPGDGRGARIIAGAGDVTQAFSAAGELGAVSMTLTRYAAEFGGSIGRQAAAADTRKQSAQAVATEASSRRQSVEGVNLDEELVRLTTYQQAFNASARMVQASKELFDILTQMI